MKMRIAIAAGLLLGAAGAEAQDAKLQVTKAGWEGYQAYLSGQSESRHGFFAMSKDGQIWGQSGCPKGQCPPDDQLKASALKRCEQFSAGVGCVIFAEDKTVLVPYEVKEYTQYGQ